MNDAKWWFLSRGVLGSLGGLVIFGLGLAGFTLDEPLKDEVVAFLQDGGGAVVSLIGVVMSGIALWGRIRATKVIAPLVVPKGPLLLLLAAVPLVFGGCAAGGLSGGSGGSAPAEAPGAPWLPYVRPAAALASSAVLAAAVSDKDRVDKANIIFGVARGVRTLAGGQVPSAAEVREVINVWSPEKSHWARLADSLAGVYGALHGKLEGEPRLAVQVLEALARGVEDAAGTVAGR